VDTLQAQGVYPAAWATAYQLCNFDKISVQKSAAVVFGNLLLMICVIILCCLTIFCKKWATDGILRTLMMLFFVAAFTYIAKTIASIELYTARPALHALDPDDF